MGVARLLVAVAAQDLPMTSVNCNKMPESIIAVAAVVLALYFVYKWFCGSSTEQNECQSLKPEMAKKKSIVAIDCEMVRCLMANKSSKNSKTEQKGSCCCSTLCSGGL